APVDGAVGDCRVVADTPERLRLRCRSDRMSFAVVADSWFPGWTARVDGQRAPIVRANLAMRAVPLPAGEHEVTLVYRPAHLGLGFVMSALGCLATLALAWRRKATRPSA
ncbi:MAG TPA: YfhO family protein, partial [Polyangia bacterium]|nr:YfhO family protein [Polyangia bacterium]